MKEKSKKPGKFPHLFRREFARFLPENGGAETVGRWVSPLTALPER